MAQEFDSRGIVVTGITLEEGRGQRSFLNVQIDVDAMDRVTAGWVVQGLQLLLRKGNRVSLGVRICGAAGRVVMIDSVCLSR